VAVFITVVSVAGFIFTQDNQAQAATSNQLNFQGRLLTQTGSLVPDGNYNIEFKLYNQLTSAGSSQGSCTGDANCLWTETSSTVKVRGGYFSIYLGSTTPLPTGIDWSQDLFLGMNVGGIGAASWDGEMSPRFKLTAVPYAFRASNVASSATNAASTNSDAVSITSGNALGTTSNSGNISIDTGTATGTTGTISLGSANASALTLGRTGLTTNNLGTLTLGQLGTANTDAVLCRNASNILAACTSTFATSATAFIQNGNSFGVGAVLGTNDAFGLNLETNNTVAVSIDASQNTTFNGNVVLAAGQSLTVTGGNTASRPASPTEGMVYYDTTTDQLLTYANGKWQADRTDAILVAAANSSQNDRDIADYVGDGNTAAANDGDQIQINQALAAASGRKVVLLAGTYVADATILVPNNTTLSGVGNGTIIELADIDVTDNLIENSDTTTGTGVVVRDLKLDGRDDLNTAGVQEGIYFNGMGSGSGAAARQGSKILNVIAEDFRNSGIYLSSSSNNTVSGNTTQGNTADGIYLSSSSNNTVSGNTTQGNTANGVNIDPASIGNTITGNTIQGNVLAGIRITFSSSSNTIVGNTIKDNGSRGIYVGPSSNNNTITGNTVQGNGSQGITLSSASNNTVSGNKIHDNGGATNDNNGIEISSGDFNSITNNNITDTACTSTCYAITIPTSTSDKNYLSGNRYSGSTTNAASINDAGTGTIYDNQQVNSTTSTNSDVSEFRLQGSANSATAFAVRNVLGTSVLNVDTSTPGVGITGALTVSALTTLNGGLTVSGAAVNLNVNSNFDTNINSGTSTGAINIGNSATSVLNLSSTSNISLNVPGALTFNTNVAQFGTNGNKTIKTANAGAANTNQITLRSGDVTGTGFSTGNLRLLTGNAGGGTNSSSGNILLDTGTASGTGTTGTISVGTTNASFITIGGSTTGPVSFNTSSIFNFNKTIQLSGGGGVRTTGSDTNNSINLNLTTGVSNGTGFSSGNINILSGAGSGTNTSSGSINLDSGTASGTGTTGTISLGSANASALTLGRAGLTTTNAGALTVTGAASFNGNLVVSAGTQFTNAGSTLLTALVITDRATGGNIGTAATTVDVATTFNVNQTTASQTLTLPAPTDTTSGRIVYVNNVGSAEFTMYGSPVSAGSSASFIWNGTSWVQTISFSSTGVDTLAAIGATPNANGATISGTTLTLQPADGSFGGVVTTAAQNFAGVKTFDDGLVVAAGQTLRVVGGNTASRPAGVAGEIYYDTDTNTLLTYNGTKWVADRGEYTIVAADDSTQAAKDVADYVADGEDSAGAGIGTLDGDQIEINNALTAANGGKVYLMEGTYTIDASISIPNNTTLAGAGENTLIQLGNFGATTTTFNAIVNTDTTTGTDVTIRDLKLDGRRSINTAGTQSGIDLDGIGDAATDTIGAIVDSVYVTSFATTSIRFDGSANSTVKNSTSLDAGFGSGVFISTSSRMTVQDNNLSDNNGYGAVFSATTDGSISGNLTSGNGGNGIGLQTSSTNNIIIANIASDNTGSGISVASSNNTVTGNTASNNTISGISVSGSNNTLTGNTASNNTLNGITISAANNTLTGNTASNNTDNGIVIIAANNTLTGNTASNNTDNGIVITAANNTLTGNTVSNNTNDGIVITAANNTLTGNTVSNNTNDGINISSAGNSVTSNTIEGNVIGLDLVTGSSNNLVNSNNISNNTNLGARIIGGPTTTFNDNKVQGNGIFGGIEVRDSVNGSFSNNSFINNGGATANNGIQFILGSATSENNSITGNIFSDDSCTTTCRAIDIADASISNTYLADNTLGNGTIRDLGTDTIYGGQLDSSGNYDIQPAGTIELLADTNITGGLTVSGTATFDGDVTIGDAIGDTLTVNAGSIQFANNFTSCSAINTDASGNLGCNTGSLLTSSLTDNITDAFDLQEGTNNYFNINTTDGSENISFGNATTNPSYSFLGTGTLTVSSNAAIFQNTTNSTSAFAVNNSSGTGLLTVDSTAGLTTLRKTVSDGVVFQINDTADISVLTISTTDSASAANVLTFNGVGNFGNVAINYAGGGYIRVGNSYYNASGWTGGTGGTEFTINPISSTNTSGDIESLTVIQSFTPTSGTATNTNLLLNNTINQTGGANGITRGIYVNPTLTSAADYRGLEIGNTSGIGLYQTSTSVTNALAGNLRIGSTTAPTVALDVTGSGLFSGTLGVTGLTTLNGGLTVTGAAVNLNASSNFNTNINTGTSTGTVAIGNSASTTTVLGTTNINTSGTATTTLGNAGAVVTAVGSTINLNSGTIVGNATTQNLFNTVATTLNFGGASTSVTIGATTGTLTVRNANQTFGNAAGSGVFTNNGATLNSTLAVANDSNGGALGGTPASPLSAAASVDVYTAISINQTTAGQTITLPSPTVTTAGRVLYISNIGSTSFIIGGTTISTGTTVTLIWNGTTWSFAGAGGSGVSSVGAISGTSNANGATITGTTLNLTAADGTNGGVVTNTTQTFAGDKTFSGAVTAQGLLTGSLGATVSGGTISLNVTGTSNTSIGNATGTLAVTSSAFNLTTAGAVSGVTTLNASGLITGLGYTAGAGLIQGTGGLTITGTTLLNTTGTAATTIGNSTGTLALLGGNSTSLVVGSGANTTTLNFIAPSGNNTISFPAATGTVQLAPTTGSFIKTIPVTTAENTITPAVASVVGLTVNATSNATGATGLIVNQSNATQTGQIINLTNTSGTQPNGLLIDRTTAGGTTTSLLGLTNTAGTATNGILFTGTIGTDITTATNRALTIDSNGTGAITIGGGTGAKTIGLGTGITGVKTINIGTGAATANLINIGGTGANVIGLGNTQTGGSISLGAALTTGTINIGGTGAQTGNINLGVGTGAQTINLGTGAGAKTAVVGSTTAGSTTTINGANGISLQNNTTITGANTFTSGTGAVTLNGSTTVSGVNTFTVGTGLTSLGGGLSVTAGNVTFTAASGTTGDDVIFSDASFQDCVLSTDSSGVLTCAASGALITLQSAYQGLNTITATDAEGDIDLTVSEATNFSVDITGTGSFLVQDGGTNVLAVSNTGAATFQNTTNSTTALRVNNAAGTSIFSVDTTNGRLGIGTTTPQSILTLQEEDPVIRFNIGNSAAYAGGLDIYSDGGTLRRAFIGYKNGVLINSLVGNVGINAPSGGTVGLNISGTSANPTLTIGGANEFTYETDNTDQLLISSSRAYFNGNIGIGVNVPQARLHVLATGTTVATLINNGTSTGDILRLQDNGTNVLTVADGGAATFQNASNSTSAFRINNAGGSAMLEADTTNFLLKVAPTQFLSSGTTQDFAASGSLTGVDSFSTIAVNATAPATIVTLPAPAVGGQVIGRVIYVTAVNGSNDFTLRLGGTAIDIGMKANSTATLIWNGTGWTAAGASSSTDLQSAYANTLSSAGGAEILLNPAGGAADGLTIRNNNVTPINGGILEIQSAIGTNLFSVNNIATEFAANGGAENSVSFGSDWESVGTVTLTRNTTPADTATGTGSVSVVTNATNEGVRNNLTTNLTPSTQYLVSFTAKTASGTLDNADLDVYYSRNGGGAVAACDNRSIEDIVATGFTKFTCTITTDGTGASNPDLIIRQTDGSNFTIFIDNLSVTENSANSEPDNVQIGGGINGGPVTLFTLDRASAPPVANGNQTFLGSMYYDTTSGRIQCYESDGWGACGSAPNNYVNLTPEYPGSVLNGTGVGTMTADFCANDADLSVNSTFCAAGEALNYYNWTSPQATEQEYSIYVTYQLPAAFKSFDSNNTVLLTGRVSSTSLAEVSYEMFRRTTVGTDDIIPCGTETTINASANVWETTPINGDEATACGFDTSSADEFVVFKINLKASQNANAYVSTLSFTSIGQ